MGWETSKIGRLFSLIILSCFLLFSIGGLALSIYGDSLHPTSRMIIICLFGVYTITYAGLMLYDFIIPNKKIRAISLVSFLFHGFFDLLFKIVLWILFLPRRIFKR